MEKSKATLLNLIKDYIDCSAYMFSLLRDNFTIDKEGFLRSRRLNLIPKEGTIENVYFSFHGGGCHFESENDVIDVDFGPNGRTDGFDLMRLSQFAKMRANKYPELIDDNVLADEFNILIKEGFIINPKLYPSPHLFYLVNN